MNEIVIISGKGGTGKTSVAASFAALAGGKAVIADCDVDAADLHIILQPAVRKNTEFISGHQAIIRQNGCNGCGICRSVCRFGAVSENAGYNEHPKKKYTIDPVACEGCGVCVLCCPEKTIDFTEEVCGEWFISDTRFGVMVHAKLGIAAENSGRLVTLVRNEAKQIALKKCKDYVVIDGSPGIGCPVIASLTATDLALIVTEPTVSGDHDLRRIAALTKRLRVPAMVCVNKWDINPEAAATIETFARNEGLQLAGRIRYDAAVTRAQRARKAVTEYGGSGAADDITAVWNEVRKAAVR
jgi:MinD superfamily P-loop ATPase